MQSNPGLGFARTSASIKGSCILKTLLFSQRERIWATFQVVVSILITIVCLLGAFHIKRNLPGRYGSVVPLEQYLDLVLVIVPAWFGFLHFGGIYHSFVQKSPLTILAHHFRMVAMGTALVMASAFLMRLHDTSRLLIVFFAALDFVFLTAWNLLLLRIRRSEMLNEANRQKALVVGTGPEAQDLIEQFRSTPVLGVDVLGAVEVDGEPMSIDRDQTRLLGHLDRIEDVLRGRVVDEVIFAVSVQSLEKIRNALLICESAGIGTRIKSDLFTGLLSKVRIDEVAGTPILAFSTTPQRPWALLAKEVFDRITAAVGLVLLSPVFVIVSLLIRLTSRGPIFFTQVRSGLNGRPFVFYKFRSMVERAEELRLALEGANEIEGPVFKIRDDPRVTTVGRFLRRYSLDELPQLVNILKGEMSFIGPRPPLPREVEKYEWWQRRRLSMKPGLTCIWQVSGRNQVPFSRWMEMDLLYIDSWSLTLDLKILLRTMPAVITGRGAM